MSLTHMNKVENFDIKVFNSIEHAMRKKGHYGIAGSIEDVWYATYHIQFSEFLGHYKTLTWSSQYRLYHSIEDEERDRMRVPDFVILRSWADNFRGRLSFDRLWVLAVVEVKPLDFKVPTDERGEEVGCHDDRFILASKRTFSTCAGQAKIQCKFVLESNDSQNVVFAMHCVGPYWTYTKYSRDLLSPFLAKDDDGEYIERGGIVVEQERGGLIAKVGTSQSKLLFGDLLYKMEEDFASPEKNKQKGKGMKAYEW